MLRFVLRCLVFAVVLMVMLTALAIWVPPDPAESSYLMSFIDKQERLSRDRKPTVILVGGSNVAFGFDSQHLSDRLEMPVLNQGLQADLGIKQMLQQLDGHLISGDILVMQFEYELWGQRKSLTPVMAAFWMDVEPEMRKRLSWFESLALQGEVSLYLGRKTKAFVERRLNKALGREVIESGLEVYRRDAFNRYGDVTSHLDKENSRPFDLPGTDFRVNPRYFRWVSDWIIKQNRNGVVCVMLPPVIEASVAKKRQDMIVQISGQLSESGIAYQIQPDQLIYPRSYFFDTQYHLNKSGIRRRTNAVADELSEVVHASRLP